MTRNPVVYAVSLAALAMMAPVREAGAAIKCSGGFQMVQGNSIATPYCQDLLLSQVARDYGMRASFDRIRYNPNYKREVCRLVGHDIRVSDI